MSGVYAKQRRLVWHCPAAPPRQRLPGLILLPPFTNDQHYSFVPGYGYNQSGTDASIDHHLGLGLGPRRQLHADPWNEWTYVTTYEIRRRRRPVAQ